MVASLFCDQDRRRGTEGQTDEDITARYTRNLRGNLRAMKKALGLPI